MLFLEVYQARRTGSYLRLRLLSVSVYQAPLGTSQDLGCITFFSLLWGHTWEALLPHSTRQIRTPESGYTGVQNGGETNNLKQEQVLLWLRQGLWDNEGECEVLVLNKHMHSNHKLSTSQYVQELYWIGFHVQTSILASSCAGFHQWSDVRSCLLLLLELFKITSCITTLKIISKNVFSISLSPH